MPRALPLGALLAVSAPCPRPPAWHVRGFLRGDQSQRVVILCWWCCLCQLLPDMGDLASLNPKFWWRLKRLVLFHRAVSLSFSPLPLISLCFKACKLFVSSQEITTLTFLPSLMSLDSTSFSTFPSWAEQYFGRYHFVLQTLSWQYPHPQSTHLQLT